MTTKYPFEHIKYKRIALGNLTITKESPLYSSKDIELVISFLKKSNEAQVSSKLKKSFFDIVDKGTKLNDEVFEIAAKYGHLRDNIDETLLFTDVAEWNNLWDKYKEQEEEEFRLLHTEQYDLEIKMEELLAKLYPLARKETSLWVRFRNEILIYAIVMGAIIAGFAAI